MVYFEAPKSSDNLEVLFANFIPKLCEYSQYSIIEALRIAMTCAPDVWISDFSLTTYLISFSIITPSIAGSYVIYVGDIPIQIHGVLIFRATARSSENFEKAMTYAPVRPFKSAPLQYGGISFTCTLFKILKLLINLIICSINLLDRIHCPKCFSHNVSWVESTPVFRRGFCR